MSSGGGARRKKGGHEEHEEHVNHERWLISYAEAMEAKGLTGKGAGDVVRPRPSPPQHIGKTEAEKLIYFITIVAWLALPLLLNVLSESSFRVPYYALAGVVLACAVWSLLADARVRRG